MLQALGGRGALYQGHWAYEKPVKAEVPPGVNGVDFLAVQASGRTGRTAIAPGRPSHRDSPAVV